MPPSTIASLMTDMGNMSTLGVSQSIGPTGSYLNMLSRLDLTPGEKTNRFVLTDAYSRWADEQSKDTSNHSSASFTFKSLGTLGKRMNHPKFNLGTKATYRSWASLTQPVFNAAARVPEGTSSQGGTASQGLVATSQQIIHLNQMLAGCPAAFLEGMARAMVTAAVCVDRYFCNEDL